MATGSALPLWRRAVDPLVLGRPHFLIGGLLLHCLGAAVAVYSGAPLHLPALLWGQLAVTSIQFATAYSNDYFDLEADRANPNRSYWSGGSGVLPAGRLHPRVALWAAVALSLVAVVAMLGISLRVRFDPLLLGMMALALAISWGYSAPPVRLHSRGLGEVTGALLVPGLTPVFGFYLQTGRVTALPLLAAAPLACFGLTMLMSVAFPDRRSDEAVGKRTLVVRLGEAGAARLYNATLLAAYATLPLLVAAGLPAPAAVAIGLTAPLAAWVGDRLRRGLWAAPGRRSLWTFCGISVLLLATTAELAAFLWLVQTRA